MVAGRAVRQVDPFEGMGSSKRAYSHAVVIRTAAVLADALGADGESAEVGVLVDRGGPGGIPATEERGEEQALDRQVGGGTEGQAGLRQHRYAVEPHLDQPVRLSGGVEPDVLLDLGPGTGGEAPVAPAERG